jgi:hypothetical protein
MYFLGHGASGGYIPVSLYGGQPLEYTHISLYASSHSHTERVSSDSTELTKNALYVNFKVNAVKS